MPRNQLKILPAFRTPRHKGRAGQFSRPRAITIYADYAANWLSPFDNRETKGLLQAMLGAARQYGIGDVELHLCDDAAISRLNALHLGAIGPTNILTFPGDKELPGVLFLSLDCLARECMLYGQPREKHLIRLLAHGIGHLAGLDHGIEMMRLEEACALAAQYLTEGRR